MNFEEFQVWMMNAKDTRLSQIPISALIFLQDRFQLFREGKADLIVEVASFIYQHKKGKQPSVNYCTDFVVQLGISSTLEKLRRMGLIETFDDFDLFELQDKHKQFRADILKRL